MSFSVIIPVENMASANAALETAGWGGDNFSVSIRPKGSKDMATKVALYHLGNDLAFRAACLALPGAVVVDAPDMEIAFAAHVSDRGLEVDKDKP